MSRSNVDVDGCPIVICVLLTDLFFVTIFDLLLHFCACLVICLFQFLAVSLGWRGPDGSGVLWKYPEMCG